MASPITSKCSNCKTRKVQKAEFARMSSNARLTSTASACFHGSLMWRLIVVAIMAAIESLNHRVNWAAVGNGAVVENVSKTELYWKKKTRWSSVTLCQTLSGYIGESFPVVSHKNREAVIHAKLSNSFKRRKFWKANFVQYSQIDLYQMFERYFVGIENIFNFKSFENKILLRPFRFDPHFRWSSEFRARNQVRELKLWDSKDIVM